MIYLALGCAALAIWLWLSHGKPVLKRREWRLMSAAFALAAFTGAAWVGVRGGWGAAIVLVVVGLWLAASARKNPPASGPPRETQRRMSEAEARSLLGVGPDAGPDEIKAAYTRLMRLVHPDAGGAAGLAAQLNAARDRLLKG